jgi:NAD(P)-dependent dehydrogenase (short-subunit alcohol dehydrogenase family)
VRKTVLVTGGGTGVGAAITARFADEGAVVVVGQRTRDEAQEAVSRLAAPGRQLIGIGADLSTAAGCRDLIAAATEPAGRLDVLVNNAALTGRAAMGPALGYPDDQLDAVLEVNLKAPFRLSRNAAPFMPPGSVIANITSVLAYRAKPETAAYQAAKAGLVALTRALGLEFAPLGIRVVHVSPASLVPDAGSATRQAATPLARCGTPADIAAAVAWLCSPEAAFVTGTGLVVDGGRTTY